MYITKLAEFFGIQQQKDGTLLNIGTARESVNMETADGNLTVAEDFDTVVEAPSTVDGETWKALFGFERVTSGSILIACSTHKIMFHTEAPDSTTWQEILTFESPSDNVSFDAQLARIWNTDYILIATGITPIVKIPIDELVVGNPSYSWFGSDVYYLNEPIAITNVDTTDIKNSIITVSGNALSETESPETRMRALVYGVYIMDGQNVKYLLYPDLVEGISSDGSQITLDLTGCTVTTSNTIQLRGGVSDKKVGSLELYHDRLWSAGDPENISRLYWSCAAGEGRTIEDWVSDDYYEDASGGHVDVGVADGDKIVALKALSDCILIFKVNSVWRLYGDRPSNYTLERVSDEVGALDDSEIITRYGIPYWLSKDGIYFSDSSTCRYTDGEVNYLAELFKGVERNARRSACSVPSLRRMFFNVHNSEIGNFILSRDLATGSYLTFNGAEFIDLCEVDGVPLFMTSDGAVLKRGDSTPMLHSHDGEPLEARWVSQLMELSNLTDKKQCRMLFFRASGGRINIKIHSDLGDMETYVTPVEMRTNVIALPVAMAEARYMQFTISNVNGSRFKIEGGISICYEKQYEV